MFLRDEGQSILLRGAVGENSRLCLCVSAGYGAPEFSNHLIPSTASRPLWNRGSPASALEENASKVRAEAFVLFELHDSLH